MEVFLQATETIQEIAIIRRFLSRMQKVFKVAVSEFYVKLSPTKIFDFQFLKFL